MILDKMDPPPRYTPKPSVSSLLAKLPPHVLLHIVGRTFPQIDGPDLERLEAQRKNLYWLCTSLRLVNRAFYIACMHVLRSTYLHQYLSLVRPPYSSDPFPVRTDFSPGAAPLYSPSSSLPGLSADPLHSIQRESYVLDLFIAVKVREDVWADDTELHLERHESFKDLFELYQPRSRLEDLVRIYGVQDSVITLQTGPSSPPSLYSTPTASSVTLVSQSTPSPSRRSPNPLRSLFTMGRSSPSPRVIIPTTPTHSIITPIPFSRLCISFTPRTAGLVLIEKQRKRTLVEVQRDRQDTLEVSAQQLVAKLGRWLKEGGTI